MLSLVTFKVYDTSAEANLVVALLENHGIEAVVVNDQDVLIDPGSLATSNIKVKVRKEDFDACEKILKENSEKII